MVLMAGYRDGEAIGLVIFESINLFPMIIE